MRNDPDAAIDHARNAVKRDKKNAKYHLTLANGYGLKAMKGGMSAMFYGGKYKEECEAAVKCDPKYVAAYMGLLQYYVMAPAIAGGGRDKANETVATIARLDHYSGHMARAFIARQDKDLAGAEREYLAAARLDSLDPKGWRMVGSFYMEQKRFRDAIRVGSRVLALVPDDLATVYLLAKAHLLLGDDLKAAESGFKRYIAAASPTDSPGPAAAHWRLGMVYLASGRYAESARAMERALQMAPDDLRAMMQLGEALTASRDFARATVVLDV
jgi:tetratricopeptide (TPR) repeat protein